MFPVHCLPLFCGALVVQRLGTTSIACRLKVDFVYHFCDVTNLNMVFFKLLQLQIIKPDSQFWPNDQKIKMLTIQNKQ